MTLQGGETFISEGTSAMYQCNLGYYLVGNYSRTCLNNGIWSLEIPTCKGLLNEYSYMGVF